LLGLIDATKDNCVLDSTCAHKGVASVTTAAAIVTRANMKHLPDRSLREQLMGMATS
jgi:hypothetical protein